MASSACAIAALNERFMKVADAPEVYDGKQVSFVAYLSYRFENKNLWATKKDEKNWSVGRCISLANPDDVQPVARKLDGKYVEVTGVISRDASEGGRVIRLAACRDVAIDVLKMQIH